MNGGDVSDNKEARQLLAVKKLMEMKGIEAMMKFLES